MKRIFLLLVVLSTSVAWAQNAELILSRFASWGLDPDKGLASIQLHETWKDFKTKRPVVVAVIDTGVDSDHPFLAKNLLPGMDFSNSTLNDVHGHGTHIAGIIKSIYPDVRILPLKYFDPRQSGNERISATVKAIKYAIAQKVDLINYSSAGGGHLKEEKEVLKEANDQGILVIAAAGNSGENIDDASSPSYPASYGLSNVLSVAGHDDQLNLVSSSNYGKKTVDIAAPGHRIRGAFPGNRTAYMTGTSQATAFVTGVAALIKAKHPKLTGPEIKEIILSSSLIVSNFKEKVSGGRKLDAARAMKHAEKRVNRLPAGR